MATIRQRKRGVWEVRVFAGRDADGKPVQISRTVRGGKKDAEKVAKELGRSLTETDRVILRQMHAAKKTVAEMMEALR